MAQPLLTIDRLSLQAGSQRIVEALSFVIYPGEILALTGKSGSGKTSIALAILDLLPKGIDRTEGTFSWRDDQTSISNTENAAAWQNLRGTRIGFVQQDIFGAFDPVLSMEHQMLMLLQEKSGLQRDQLLLELTMRMNEVGLQDIPRLLKSYPFQLSGGQLQRCMIALIMTLRPALIILDEPTSAIDKINQDELISMLSALSAQNHMAILCITHEEDVVRRLAGREINLEGTGSVRHDPVKNRINNGNDILKVILEGRQLTYTYHFGGLVHKTGAVVGPIDFTLYAGQCMGVIGESGSGKSTLAQLLVGLIGPQQGFVLLDDQPIDINLESAKRRLRTSVQLVMQDGRGSLHPHLTIRQILEEVIRVQSKHFSSATQSPETVLREVGLTPEMLDRRPGQLSGGECLRVSIARALLMNPKVLICDESTSALDTETRDGILHLLSDLMHNRGTALIVISHDITVIRQLSDHILVMAAGQVVESGAASAVINTPSHPASIRIFSPDATFRENWAP